VIVSDEPMDTLYAVTEESPDKIIQLRSK
jgi:ornithine decarboxylase